MGEIENDGSESNLRVGFGGCGSHFRPKPSPYDEHWYCCSGADFLVHVMSRLLYVAVLFVVVVSQPWSTHGVVLTSGERLAPAIKHHHDNLVGTPTSVWDVSAVELWATHRGLREHHLKSIYKGVFQSKNENDFRHFMDESSDIPKTHRASFFETFQLLTCSCIDVKQSSNGTVSTMKMLVNVSSGRAVETVLIRHGDGRCTVCVSSQVGCARNCSFCATGTMGLLQNLPAADILQQVWLARGLLEDARQLRNVVFMGMVRHGMETNSSISFHSMPTTGRTFGQL